MLYYDYDAPLPLIKKVRIRMQLTSVCGVCVMCAFERRMVGHMLAAAMWRHIDGVVHDNFKNEKMKLGRIKLQGNKGILGFRLVCPHKSNLHVLFSEILGDLGGSQCYFCHDAPQLTCAFGGQTFYV